MKFFRFKTLFIFLFSVVSLGQSLKKGLVFSEDLHTLAKESISNITAEKNDEVRGNVVAFLPQEERAFTIPNVDPQKTLTVSFWFKPKKVGVQSGTLFGEKNRFYFRYLSNRELQFNHYKRRDVNTLGMVTNDIWQHVAFTIQEDSKLKVYYNGACVLADSIAVDWWKAKREDFILGVDKYGVNAEGSMDRLRIWNRVLSPEKIKQEYQTGIKEPSLNHKLQAYFPLKGDFKDLSLNPKKLVAIKDVAFVKDEKKGMVANFSSQESVVTLDGFHFTNQLTLSLWIKPEQKEWLMGLVGNKSFALRYSTYKRRMWFGVPLSFTARSNYKGKYHNEWQHLTAVVNYDHLVQFYLNGELVDTLPVEGSSGGKETLLNLGKSLWGDPYKGKMSEFAIWNRALTANEVKDVFIGKLETAVSNQEKPLNLKVYLVIAAVLLVLGVGFVLIKKKNTKGKVAGNVIVEETNFPMKNALFLLESFRAFDKDGKDISHEFTPTLIRLLSVIVLYPKVKNRYVTSSELSDLLWQNDTTAQQKSNRSTNMHRLRKILNQFENVSIAYEERKWMLKADDAFVDVLMFNSSTHKELLSYPFKSLQLNKNLKVDSFDKIIMQFNELAIEKLKANCEASFQQKKWSLLNKSAALWLTVDSLSEVALAYRLTALTKLNKKQTALSVHEHFVTNHQQMLGESFSTSFADCLL